MLTNRLGLPEPVARAVANDPYTKGDSDISVTQLIAPPYQRWLRERTEPVEDVADRIWSLLGQATHNILERAWPVERPRETTIQEFYLKHRFLREERVKTEVNGWVVSGAFDAFENGILKDFKVTSVWSVMGETKKEWEQQLNLLRLLLVGQGFTVDRLQIIAILRDWSKLQAKVKGAKEYPQLGVEVVDIPVWTIAETKAYLEERVRLHQSQQPEPCNDNERWKTENVYAVMKDGRKTAVKLHASQEAADNHAGALGKGHNVILRPGEFRRCADYCNVVHACPIMKSEVPF
jgi:hypothetical protein